MLTISDFFSWTPICLSTGRALPLLSEEWSGGTHCLWNASLPWASNSTVLEMGQRSLGIAPTQLPFAMQRDCFGWCTVRQRRWAVHGCRKRSREHTAPTSHLSSP